LRGDQFHFVPGGGELTRPVMCAATRLHHHQRRRLARHELEKLWAANLLAEQQTACHGSRMNLEHRFCQIHANHRILHLPSSLFVAVYQPPHWHIAMPFGEDGNHPISPEMLPWPYPLPHQTCSRLEIT
jgi:hypothetical protein